MAQAWDNTLGTEKGAGHVQLLATNHNDTLAAEDLLGNNGGKATQQMTLSVDDNNLAQVRMDAYKAVPLPFRKPLRRTQKIWPGSPPALADYVCTIQSFIYSQQYWAKMARF